MGARIDLGTGISEIMDTIIYKRLLGSLKTENIDRLVESSVSRIVDHSVTRAISDLMNIERGSSFQAYCTKQVAKYATKNKMNAMIEEAVAKSMREISPEIVPAIREAIDKEIKEMVHREFKRKLPEYVRSAVNEKVNNELEKSALLAGYNMAQDLIGTISFSVNEPASSQSLSDEEE